MFKTARLLCLLGSFLAATSLSATTPRADHVLVISIDGGSPKAIHQSRMPVLQKLVREGAHTWNARTIRPSLTLPAHTSMLTGVTMERHQVTWNDWNPTNGLVSVPTIFAAAAQAGLSTAMFVGKEKFRHFLQPNTVNHFDYDTNFSVFVLKNLTSGEEKKKEGNVTAGIVAANAARHLRSHQPKLCFVHFTDPDTIGHEFGWGSPEQLQAFADVDAALGLLLDALHQADLAHRTVIIISADHGGHGKGHSQGTQVDMAIPWIAWGKGVKPHHVIREPVNTCDTAATALWLLGTQPLAPITGIPVVGAFR